MENAPLLALKERALTPAPVIVKKASEPSLGVKFVTAGVAACIADLITFPLDTAKVRLQIQGEGASGSAKGSALSAVKGSSSRYNGLVGTLCTISRQEGPKALYNGLAPGLQRQMCFASIRIGLYDSVKQTYSNLLQNVGLGGSVIVRLLAGSTTGAMAVACAQPTDVVKVRMQAQKAGTQRYKGVIAAYRTIAQQEGMKGLWKGTSPNIARNAIINCCELVTYDMIKEKILATQLLPDSLPCHFLSATGAGFIATVVGSPVDVVKTRFMNSPQGTYSGVINCAMVMFKNEGFKAFYKGFTPSFTRLVTWNIVMFVSYEQLKKAIMNRREQKLLPTLEIKRNTQRYM